MSGVLTFLRCVRIIVTLPLPDRSTAWIPALCRQVNLRGTDLNSGDLNNTDLSGGEVRAREVEGS